VRARIVSPSSDLGRFISGRLVVDGWEVEGVKHNDYPVGSVVDLLVVCSGTLRPVGKFESFKDPPELGIYGLGWSKWTKGVYDNLLSPLEHMLRALPLPPESSVVFFSGTNPEKLNPFYSAYSVAKAGLFRAVQEINGEVDCKVFMLAPGFVDTKIHEATREAGVPNARLEAGGGTSKEKIYQCLMWCHKQPKEKVGGQSIYVPKWQP